MRPLVGSLASALLRRRERPSFSVVAANDARNHSVFDKHVEKLPEEDPETVTAAALFLSLFVLDEHEQSATTSNTTTSARRSTKGPDASGEHTTERAVFQPQFPWFRMPSDSRSHIDLSSASDLRAAPRDIAIVTTAAIPWMTGTAVNPLLRAVFLARHGHRVSLIVPWLSAHDEQAALFGASMKFATKIEHRRFMHEWLQAQRFGDVRINFLFYDAVYSETFGSILPVGAITDVFVPNHGNDDTEKNLVRDVCILEEPEHLTWHHPGEPWTELFRIVIGVIHTNYIAYTRKYGFFGPQRAFFLLMLNIWVCRSYCHRVIKLSDAVQHFPHSVTCNVHGVRDRFLDIGRAGRQNPKPFKRGAYFLAKALWAKGYTELLSLLRSHYSRTGVALPVRFFGDGADAHEIANAIQTEPGPFKHVHFQPKIVDHAGDLLQEYRLYVNASVSDVVCTATAEALAMGKAVLVLEHPSNAFFATFANCKTFSTPQQFSTLFTQMLQLDPPPLSEHDLQRLTWEAATNRFYEAALMPVSKRRPSKVDGALANAHAALSKIYPHPGQGVRRENEKLREAGAFTDTKSLPAARGNTGVSANASVHGPTT